jgi:hypothetical protein
VGRFCTGPNVSEARRSRAGIETRYTETEAGSQNDVTNINYVRSTVLGGAVIAGVDQLGGKHDGYVYAGGQKITDMSGLHNVNPVTGSWVSTVSAGVIVGTRTELDPLGADVGAWIHIQPVLRIQISWGSNRFTKSEVIRLTLLVVARWMAWRFPAAKQCSGYRAA